MDLVTVWFALVVLCWVLFFALEGFDFGVGMLAPLLGRTEHERAAAVRTVGPFWDGNEVWLVAAIGVMFAAFPGWYAAALSGLYLPVVLLLLLLAGRGVAIEFRGKGPDAAWRRRCDTALALCSAGIVLLWGAVLAVFARGLALGPDQEVHSTGGALAGLRRTVDPLLTPAAGLGAALALVAALLLGATFLGLRTTGPVRERARRVAIALGAGVAALAGVVAAALATTEPPGAGLVVAAAVAVVAGAVALAARARREAVAFTTALLAVAAAVVAVLTVNGAVVLPSTLDPAWSLTRESAAATDSALRLISTVGVVAIPGVIAYQALSYWVFRRRVASERLAS